MGDDFSAQVKRALASRVGYICSNSGCRALTTGPQDDPTKSLNVGVAAHITAASPGGPRYDPALSVEERCSLSNGIWLCQSCAKLVDNDPLRFTVDVLRAWKQDAEAKARDRVGKTAVDHELGLPKRASGASEIDVSLKAELEHAGKITRYRIGIHNKDSRLMENLKMSISEISPWSTPT
jgi:hypothetical protein